MRARAYTEQNLYNITLLRNSAVSISTGRAWPLRKPPQRLSTHVYTAVARTQRQYIIYIVIYQGQVIPKGFFSLRAAAHVRWRVQERPSGLYAAARDEEVEANSRARDTVNRSARAQRAAPDAAAIDSTAGLLRRAD